MRIKSDEMENHFMRQIDNEQLDITKVILSTHQSEIWLVRAGGWRTIHQFPSIDFLSYAVKYMSGKYRELVKKNDTSL